MCLRFCYTIVLHKKRRGEGMLHQLADKRLLLLEDNTDFIDHAVALFKMFVAEVCVHKASKKHTRV